MNTFAYRLVVATVFGFVFGTPVGVAAFAAISWLDWSRGYQ